MSKAALNAAGVSLAHDHRSQSSVHPASVRIETFGGRAPRRDEARRSYPMIAGHRASQHATRSSQARDRGASARTMQRMYISA